MSRGRPPNTKRDEEIIRRFEADPSLDDGAVARMFGLSRSRVQDIRYRAGLVRGRGSRPGSHPFLLRHLDRNREIAARYPAGETLGDLAREYGLSRERIRQIIRAGGGTLRRPGRPRRPEPMDEIM